MTKIDFMENSIDEIINLIKNSQLDSAQKRIKALLKKNKHFYVYHLQGLIFLQTEKYGDAIKFFNLCTNLKDDFPDAFNGLGVAYTKLGDNLKAIENLKKAIFLNPFLTEARFNLSNIYLAEKRPFDAEKELEYVLKRDSNNFNAINLMADIKSAQQETSIAIDLRIKSLEINESADVYLNLGNDYLSLGDYEKAEKNYKRSFEIFQHASSLYSLAQLPNYKFNQDELSCLNLIFEQNDDIEDKIYAGFSLANHYKKERDFELSYNFLCKSNQLKDSTRNFNRKNLENLVSQVKKNYLDLKEKIKIDKDSNPIPIFILGLPRSGSTLIEQIVSNYPGVYGAGELGLVGPVIASSAEKNNFSLEKIYQIRFEYFTHIKMRTNLPFFTDKTAGNFIHLGLLNLIFPEAFIIHTERDSFSTAFSIFENNFEDKKLSWAFDQNKIFQYMKIHKDLMNYWFSLKIKKLLNCNYESLVNNPDEEIKKIFKFLEFKKADDYIDFTKNKRPVFTASATQVRSEINKEGLDKSKKYGSAINEFKQLISKLDK